MGWSSKWEVIEMGRGTNTQEWGLFPIQGKTLDGCSRRGKQDPGERLEQHTRARSWLNLFADPHGLIHPPRKWRARAGRRPSDAMPRAHKLQQGKRVAFALFLICLETAPLSQLQRQLCSQEFQQSHDLFPGSYSIWWQGARANYRHRKRGKRHLEKLYLSQRREAGQHGPKMGAAQRAR